MSPLSDVITQFATALGNALGLPVTISDQPLRDRARLATVRPGAIVIHPVGISALGVRCRVELLAPPPHREQPRITHTLECLAELVAELDALGTSTEAELTQNAEGGVWTALVTLPATAVMARPVCLYRYARVAASYTGDAEAGVIALSGIVEGDPPIAAGDPLIIATAAGWFHAGVADPDEGTLRLAHPLPAAIAGFAEILVASAGVVSSRPVRETELCDEVESRPLVIVDSGEWLARRIAPRVRRIALNWRGISAEERRQWLDLLDTVQDAPALLLCRGDGTVLQAAVERWESVPGSLEILLRVRTPDSFTPFEEPAP